MARFFLAAEQWDSDPMLCGEEARHLSQVLRAKVGDSITVFDGMGRKATAEIDGITREFVKIRLLEIHNSTPIRPRIVLAQAIPKGKNMDLIVQKAVELGISSIQPLITRHTVVQPGEGKSIKWRKIALEACKQCGQDFLPRVEEPVVYDSWIKHCAESGGLKMIASLVPGCGSLRDALRSATASDSVTLLVGPEGDFSHDETQAAVKAGFLPISLGTIVLRVETAALYCLSSVRYEFQ